MFMISILLYVLITASIFNIPPFNSFIPFFPLFDAFEGSQSHHPLSIPNSQLWKTVDSFHHQRLPTSLIRPSSLSRVIRAEGLGLLHPNNHHLHLLALICKSRFSHRPVQDLFFDHFYKHTFTNHYTDPPDTLRPRSASGRQLPQLACPLCM